MGKELKVKLEDIKTILATDCGSTTTKAILIEKKGDEYRQTFRGEAPTTVESPFDDVTIGVVNSVTEIEELAERKIVKDNKIVRRYELPDNAPEKEGVDIYVSTSSAGGGLQMMVAGVVRNMTAKSAESAALGAGAIVMDVISVDDRRQLYERIERIRHLRPDIILLSGGTDGGTKKHVIELAETILAADPRPRFGADFKLPLVYAGNKDVQPEIRELMDEHTALKIVDNIRPTLEVENREPARDAIHDVFLEHVMAHAPGYDKLMNWTDADIMSTPHAVGLIIQNIAREYNISVLAVDIGGATTDVFSVFYDLEGKDIFNRTVSANYGMSYSISNVLMEAGLDNIIRWMPYEVSERDIRNRLRNKMIRPTTIPQALEDLLLEQAVSREALRLAFDHHKMLATGLKGIMQERTVADAFTQSETGQTLVNMMQLNMIVGSGGVLSHAPDRRQAALMMLDAYQPEGLTTLSVDSIFMMPHLGVLSTVHPQAAAQVFIRDCIVWLGSVVAPVGPQAKMKEGAKLADVVLNRKSGTTNETINFGELKLLELPLGEEAEIIVQPIKKYNVGAGPGQEMRQKIKGGIVGLILDGRGRPIALSADKSGRAKQMGNWLNAMGLKF